MIKTPSKHISRARLEQIQKDNAIGEGGQEYCEAELEALIAAKKDKEAMASLDAARKVMDRLAHQAAVNDFLTCHEEEAQDLIWSKSKLEFFKPQFVIRF